MSEPKLISPLLDGFAMGNPISEHHGVRCCPAMRDGSDEKYIVKIISIPASQVQLDALLLSGAFNDQEAALGYFNELAQSTVKEAEVLGHLSKLEGFSGYEGWQIVPMDDGVGFEVYLLGSYKRSLDKLLKRSHMTQLGAINLGLDICAALASCRRAGCLYIDLKPENIFIGDDQSYRIGDLGLVSLSSLKYASLPDRYRSSYTAPEITDAYSSLNETLDIYALGLTLYKIYNDGVLPFEGKAPAEVLPAPMYADYEMAEIILKACAPDPADRWQDPTQMGQALVNYMQRNGANDVPIVPLPAALEEEPEAPVAEDAPQEEAPVQENADIADLSFMEQMVSDETAPTEESALDLDDAAVSQDTSDMLALADDLIAHETPDPVVAPAKIDVPIPAPILPETEAAEEESAPSDQSILEEVQADVPEDSTTETESEEDILAIPPVQVKKKKSHKWIVILLLLLLLAGAAYGGYYYYQNYYLQDVTGFELDGIGSQLTVTVKTEAPEEKLTVTCTDTYGNTIPSKVEYGKAVFTDLKPNTQYQVELTVEGNYELVGKTTDTYVTPAQSNIVSLQAVTGAEDGSVILSFTVDGPDSPSGWIITCHADGEEDRVQTVTAHWATLSGLTVGTEYTITISSADPIEIAGETELKVTASPVITAQDLAVTACGDGQLTVSWNTPEGAAVEKWSVRCFNEVGYDVTQEINGTEAVFSDINTAYAYTIEVTAQGMTQCAQTGITADPITIVSVAADTSDFSQLTFHWGYDGSDPEGGWLVLCSVDGNSAPEVIKTETNSLSVSPLLPGSTYVLTFQTVEGTTLFNNTFTYKAPEAEKFSGYYLTDNNFSFRMCRTPGQTDWKWNDVAQENYTNTFKVGEKASFVVKIDKIYAISYTQIVTMFVIRDENGIAVQVGTSSAAWSDMWFGGYGEMDIPQMPETAGDYTVTVYFNGQYVSSTDFTVTE